MLPLVVLAVGGLRGELGANPIERVLNQLGLLALTSLVASLAMTPLKTLTGWTWPVRVRRTVGLVTFTFVALHFAMYLVDHGFDLKVLAEDVGKRPFILLGFLAMVLLAPLAITSTDAWVRRLGFVRWKRLHRLAYVAGVLAALHYYLRVKADVRGPVLYASVIALLFAVRIFASLRSSKGPPHEGTKSGTTYETTKSGTG